MIPRRNNYTFESQTLDIAVEDLPADSLELHDLPAPPPKSRVLLLDDRQDFRDAIAEYLLIDYAVIAVANGAEGLRKIMKDPFDLIICDMLMPQVGGEMFYWAVSRVRPAACQRFIFFTGHRNDPKIESFFNRISATVLIKPFPLGALSAAMREVTEKVR